MKSLQSRIMCSSRLRRVFETFVRTSLSSSHDILSCYQSLFYPTSARMLLTLPTVLLQHIAAYLMRGAFFAMTVTCKRFRAMSDIIPCHWRLDLPLRGPINRYDRFRHVGLNISTSPDMAWPAFSRLERVTVLVSHAYTKQTNHLFQSVQKHCPHLKTLTFNDYVDEGVCVATQVVPSVTHVHVMKAASILHTYACFPNLTSLTVTEFIIQSLDDIQHLPQIPWLRVLAIGVYPSMLQGLVVILQRLRLERLNLSVFSQTPVLRPTLATVATLTVDQLSIQVTSSAQSLLPEVEAIFTENAAVAPLHLGKSSSITVKCLGRSGQFMAFSQTISPGSLSRFGHLTGYVARAPLASELKRLGCFSDGVLSRIDVKSVVAGEYEANALVKLRVRKTRGMWTVLAPAFENLVYLLIDGHVHADAPWGVRRPFSDGTFPCLRELAVRMGATPISCNCEGVSPAWHDMHLGRLERVHIELGCLDCDRMMRDWLREYGTFAMDRDD